jgi:nicotinamidase-related amidase
MTGIAGDPGRLRVPARTTLAVIDIQERLAPAMAPTQQPVVQKAVRVLISLAREAGWPTLVTEQYPKGLGHTIPALTDALGANVRVIEKVSFSACGAPGFLEGLHASEGVVVVGMETHVCVLETALDLVERGLRVFVPWDGVASRREEDRHAALASLRQAGVVVTSSETLVFQHLREARGEAFKSLSRLLR